MNFEQAVICLILLSLGNFFLAYIKVKKKAVGYPPFLYCMLWAIVLLLHLFFKATYMEDLYALSERVLSLFVYGGLTTTVAGAIVMYFPSINFEKNKSAYTISSDDSKKIIRFRIGLTVLSFALLPVYIMKVLSIGKDGISDNILFNIRYEMVVNEINIGPIAYAQFLGVFVMGLQFLCLQLSKTKGNKWLFGISLFLAIVYTFFSTGRGYYLFLVSVLFGIQLALGKLSRKLLALAFGSFLVIFIIVGMLLNKVDTSNKEGSVISSSMFAIGLYTVVPLNAFDYELSKTATFNSGGANTLRFFIAFAEKTGLFKGSRNAEDLVQEFVFVPYPCNVYTVYSPYYRDFGTYGAIAFMFILICFHTFLFRRALKGSFSAILAYAFFLFPLLFSFFQDQYFSLLSTWLQFFLLLGGYGLFKYIIRYKIL